MTQPLAVLPFHHWPCLTQLRTPICTQHQPLRAHNSLPIITLSTYLCCGQYNQGVMDAVTMLATKPIHLAKQSKTYPSVFLPTRCARTRG